LIERRKKEMPNPKVGQNKEKNYFFITVDAGVFVTVLVWFCVDLFVYGQAKAVRVNRDKRVRTKNFFIGTSGFS
jgi:p-aminobenzoyl-glutamate transporter AbgT